MPNWSEVLQQIQQTQGQHQFFAGNAQNLVRHQYLKSLNEKTGRNIIAYYSGFLSKPNVFGTELNDEDKNGFMMAVHKMDRSKGLDLILHTPGGGITATQSIVDYLYKMFKKEGDPVPDIRAIVPQIAMSAGTMIACSCKEIWMAKHSNMGPIDPQLLGVPAYGVLREFRRACAAVKRDPSSVPIWQSIMGQYKPTFLSRCENAIKLSNEFVKDNLAKVMFYGKKDAKKRASKVVHCLTHYTGNKTHDRHIHGEECLKMGLVVKSIEDDPSSDVDFQDLILTVHHCYMHILMNTPVFKVIENHMGVGMTKSQLIQGSPGKT